MLGTSRGLSHQPAPNPQASATPEQFAHALRALRRWAGLTLDELAKRHALLPRATVSEKELARSLPTWDFVRTFVLTCLAHRSGADEDYHYAQLRRWETAWQRMISQTRQPATVPSRSSLRTVASTAAPIRPRKQGPPAKLKRGRPPRRHTVRITHRALAGSIAAAVVLLTAAIIIAPAPRRTTAYGDQPRIAQPTIDTTMRAEALRADRASRSHTRNDDQTPDDDIPIALHAGTVKNFTTAHGIDLDTGKIGTATTEGIDLRLGREGTSIFAPSEAVVYAVLPAGINPTQQHYLCQHATRWTRNYHGLHHLDAGALICVRTDQGNLAAVIQAGHTLEGSIQFTSTTWRKQSSS